ncbi:hypothetical protein HPP92_023613 [Vanilla planifolia]|uniref:Uncharacterized protein n=1 Tax=Vanilla planifolia TaxID=51239 RepID=A0A835PKX9_VANPL|nr:hypothetical protein HPP92_023922 [Vanilla planifolia]KAG0455825.1 hypothetical protein HPP92_023613 [Vanilla planifolia]
MPSSSRKNLAWIACETGPRCNTSSIDTTIVPPSSRGSSDVEADCGMPGTGA